MPVKVAELASVAHKKALRYPDRVDAIARALEWVLAVEIRWVDVDHQAVLPLALEKGPSSTSRRWRGGIRGRRKTEDGERTREEERQGEGKTENGQRKTEKGRRRTEDGRRKTHGAGWRTERGEWNGGGLERGAQLREAVFSLYTVDDLL